MADLKKRGTGTRAKKKTAPAGTVVRSATASTGETLSAIVRHSPLAVICTDLDGNVQMWNPAAERMFGWSEQEALGKMNPIVPKEKIQEYRNLQGQVRSGHPYISKELERQRKDSTRITLNACSAPLRDESGEITGLLGVFEDITERKQIELKIAEQSALLQQIMDTANVGIGSVDMEGRFSQANRQMADLFGYTVREFIGSSYLDHVHPSEREAGKAGMQALLTGTVSSVELDRLYQRKDGSSFWGHLTCNRFYGAHGNSLGLIGTITDITDRKNAEQALSDSEEKLSMVLDNVGAYIFIKDRKYRYTYVNKRSADLFRKRTEDIVGKSDADFFDAASVDEIMRSDRTVIEEGKTVTREEVDLTVPEGDARTYWTVKLPLRDSTGVVTGLCGISTDITDRKRTEETKNRLLEAVSASTEGIGISDEKDRFIYVNDAHSRISGHPRHELLGKSWRDFTPPELVPIIDAEFSRTLRNRAVGIWTGEVPAIWPDGTVVPTEVTATARWDDAGNYLGHICIVRDITERKKAQEQLVESEERYRKLFENSVSPILVIDGSGNYLDCNDAALTFLECTREEVLKKNVADYIPPALQQQQVLDSHMPLWEHGGIIETDYYIHGRVKTLALSINRFKWKDSLAVFAIGNDITERKKVEASLRESEQRFRGAFENAAVGACMVDLTGRFIKVNRFLCEMLGYKEEELLTKTFSDVTHPDDIQIGLDYLKRLIGGEMEFASFEKRYVRKDGTIVHLIVSPALIRDGAGAPQYFEGLFQNITERKKAEEQLWRSRNMLTNVLNTMPQSVFWKDTSSVYLGCNDIFARACGFERPEQIVGKSDLDLPWPRPESEAYRADDQEVMQSKLPKHHIIEPLHRPDGSRLWIDTSKVPLTGKDGTVFGVLGVFDDITDRKEREIQQEKDHKLLELIARTQQHFIRERSAGALFGKLLNDFLDLMDSEYGFIGEVLYQDNGQPYLRTHAITNIAWNDEMRKFYADHVQTGFEFFNLNTLFGEVMKTEAAVFSNDPSRDSRKGGLPEGHPALNSFLGLPFILDGRMVGMIGIANRPGGYDDRMVSYLQPFAAVCANIIGSFRVERARIQAEEKLRESEQFSRSILDTVDEGFIVIGRDYRIMTANKAYCSQVVMACEEVIGRHCYSISHHIDRPCHEAGEECVVRKVLESGKPEVALHKHSDREGHTLYVETKGFPIRDQAGTILSVIETISNITEKHLLEEERLKTQKLESIGMLAGGIAHDFNNLLQGVFGYISLAKVKSDDRTKSMAALEQAEKALHQSVSLTSQLLTFSKGGKPARKRIFVQPVIENAVKFALSGSRSEYQFSIDPDLRPVDGDAGQLGQVIQNIVLNADQSMPIGGRVLIKARNMPSGSAHAPGLPAGDCIEITIEDSGIGIPEQYLGKIFDPYFTTKEKGSGLGLATAYSIVKNHNGQLRVESEMGKGSVFFLYLPAAAALPETAAVHPSAPPAPINRLRILAMDDEDLVRNLIEEMLRALGHEVETASHGEEALEKYRAAADTGKPFDCVILDYTIRGGMGGAETIQRLKQMDPAVKAIVSSGYSNDDAVTNFRKNGFIAFLKKPYDIEELRKTLQDFQGAS